MSNILKVFVTDDDEFFRMAIELVINSESDMEVIGTAANGVEAIEKIQKLQPDVVLMDIKMPIMNGIDCIKRIKMDYPEILFLILTTFNEEEYIIEGLANGANGYLVKGIDFTLLLNMIRDVIKGQYLLPVEVATKLAKFALQKVTNETENVLPEYIYSSNTFTRKEKEILVLLARRFSNREIADKLFIRIGTLRNYLTIIYQKLDVKNRLEAIAILTEQEE